MVKNHRFCESKVTSSNCLFCLIKSPELVHYFLFLYHAECSIEELHYQ